MNDLKYIFSNRGILPFNLNQYISGLKPEILESGSELLNDKLKIVAKIFVMYLIKAFFFDGNASACFINVHYPHIFGSA